MPSAGGCVHRIACGAAHAPRPPLGLPRARVLRLWHVVQAGAHTEFVDVPFCRSPVRRHHARRTAQRLLAGRGADDRRRLRRRLGGDGVRQRAAERQRCHRRQWRGRAIRLAVRAGGGRWRHRRGRTAADASVQAIESIGHPPLIQADCPAAFVFCLPFSRRGYGAFSKRLIAASEPVPLCRTWLLSYRCSTPTGQACRAGQAYAQGEASESRWRWQAFVSMVPESSAEAGHVPMHGLAVQSTHGCPWSSTGEAGSSESTMIAAR